MKRLQTWLRKHQDETLPDGSKNQLLVSVQTYYKLALQEPELKEPAFALVDDILKLPEGKLITGKSKKQCLRWIDALTGKTALDVEGEECESTSRLVVIDVDGSGRCTLMDEASGDTREAVEVRDEKLCARIKTLFDTRDSLSVLVAGDSGMVLSVVEE